MAYVYSYISTAISYSYKVIIMFCFSATCVLYCTFCGIGFSNICDVQSHSGRGFSVTFNLHPLWCCFYRTFFHPVKKFINMSQTLGHGRFLWALRVGAALLLLQSTQSWKVSIVLLTITYVIHVLLLQKKMLNSRRHRKLSSQELENVTVTNNSYS